MRPTIDAIGLRETVARSGPTLSGKSPRTMPPPSSGGSGIRLNRKRRTVRVSATERQKAAAKASEPAGVPGGGATIRLKPADSGGTKRPKARSSLRVAKTSDARSRFAAGPAADIAARRRGWRWPQEGSKGEEAQPIIQPELKKVSSGTTIAPNGSRLMCGQGLSVT